jgi:AraC-like DNA-binding protein
LEETDNAPPTLRDRGTTGQNRDMRAGAVSQHRICTNASTAPVVAALFVVECGDDMPVMSLPRAEAQLVVRFGPSATRSLDVHAVGTRRKVHRKAGRRGQRVLVARLHPGASESVLGATAATVAERIVPLEDLWGAAETRRLVDRLFSARDMVDAAAILERAIADRLIVARGSRGRVQLALDAAGRLAGASLTTVAADLDVSARHLRRIFHETFGVSPKAFTRLTRFHRALRAARRDGHASWASIAAAAGYYDQAHLIAEFRAIAGAPPRAFLDELGAALSVD